MVGFSPTPYAPMSVALYFMLHLTFGAEDENRTRVTCLEGKGSTSELHPHMVGTERFELSTLCFLGIYVFQLHHVPTLIISLAYLENYFKLIITPLPLPREVCGSFPSHLTIHCC